MTVDFNINDTVFVQLTDSGRAIHKASHMDLFPQLPYSAAAEDADGWSAFKMWQLMQIFGPHLGIFRPMLFHANIRLETK